VAVTTETATTIEPYLAAAF